MGRQRIVRKGANSSTTSCKFVPRITRCSSRTDKQVCSFAAGRWVRLFTVKMVSRDPNQTISSMSRISSCNNAYTYSYYDTLIVQLIVMLRDSWELRPGTLFFTRNHTEYQDSYTTWYEFYAFARQKNDDYVD